MTAISANYRELTAADVVEVVTRCADAWKNPDIPRRQYELAAKGELERFRAGERTGPFAALLKCWHAIPWGAGYKPTVLDVGASGGYYSEILNTFNNRVHYTGLDLSDGFAQLAAELYPGIDYRVADARRLPFDRNSFEVVLNGACIMHVLDYAKVIEETARVAERWAIFHRTPITAGETTFFEKEAYGIPCLEIHFNAADLFHIFLRNGLQLRHTETLFWDNEARFGHQSFLLEKIQPDYELPHHPV